MTNLDFLTDMAERERQAREEKVIATLYSTYKPRHGCRGMHDTAEARYFAYVPAHAK